jgi:hypothetical protein
MNELTDNQVAILIWFQDLPSGWYTAQDVKLTALVKASAIGQALKGLYRRGVINRKPSRGREPARYKLLACSRWLGLSMTKGRCLLDAPVGREFRAGELTHIAPPTAIGPALLALAVDGFMSWEWRDTGKQSNPRARWYRMTRAGRLRKAELMKVSEAWLAAGL